MKKYASAAAALLLVVICYPLARPFTLEKSALSHLASHYRFEKLPLLEISDHPPYKQVRQTHPSLSRIPVWVSSLGAAASLADLDGDGLPNDVASVDPRTDLVTVAPVPGTGDRYKPFAFGSADWAGEGYDLAALAPMGTLLGDFNEDGACDILVYFWGRAPVMLLQQKRGAGLAVQGFSRRELIHQSERWYSNAAIQADFDGDGALDLLIGNYYHDGARVLDSKATGQETLHAGKAKALNGGHKHFFLREKSAGNEPAYKRVPDALPTEIGRGWTLAMAAADFDGDLLPEIYIANDFGPDRFLHNRSTPGRLEFALLEGERDLQTPKSCVLGHDSFKGMGLDFGDVNGDGLLDIFVSNIATKFGLTESHFLWLNTGQTEKMKSGIAPFIHGSEKLGLARSGFAFEARLADFNNDGLLEAMQACGFIKGKINRWPELQALGTSNDQMIQDPRFWPNFKPGADLSGSDCNPFFVRAPDGRFYDITPQLGLATPMVSRGLAIADVDRDGRLDYVAANQWEASYFFKNNAPSPGAYLGLRLQHANGVAAVGAITEVELPGGRKLVGWVDGGSGHSGRRSPDIHLGLGTWDKTKPVTVGVHWRNKSGQPVRDSLSLLPGWHTITLTEPSASSLALVP